MELQVALVNVGLVALPAFVVEILVEHLPAPAGKTHLNHQHHRRHDRVVKRARVGVGST